MKPTLDTLNKKLDKILSLLKNPPVEITGKSKEDELDSDKYIKLEMKSYMTPRYLFEECKKLFPFYIYNEKSLDNIISNRKGDYTVYFKNVQEADEENKNLSANDLKEKGIKSITLEERLALEIEYFKRTGNNLDIKNITLCEGSHDQNGNVPCVYWHSVARGVVADWCSPGDCYDSLRARSNAIYG